MKKQTMKFQQGNMMNKGFTLHVLLKPSHTKPAGQWPLLAEKYRIEYLPSHFHIHCP